MKWSFINVEHCCARSCVVILSTFPRREFQDQDWRAGWRPTISGQSHRHRVEVSYQLLHPRRHPRRCTRPDVRHLLVWELVHRRPGAGTVLNMLRGREREISPLVRNTGRLKEEERPRQAEKRTSFNNQAMHSPQTSDCQLGRGRCVCLSELNGKLEMVAGRICR